MITAASNQENNQTWYKNAVIYELHLRAFCDSNGDGVGDFRGALQKLDYLQDLGVTALWLLPFYPSPLRDNGYDIADFCDVHPQFGVLQDFKDFLQEAHRRGLRVFTELVINHTSDQHAWFQRARNAAASDPWRDFYVWNEHPNKYSQTRIIFKDFETSNWTWDPVAKAYFWHRFYAHQPDLNFDNPAVCEAVFEVMDFWLDLGVDGLRLDAIPYLYERENTNCENLPETHVFLKRLRSRMDQKYPGRIFLAEANQWPEETVQYFGAGDECQMCFHFPVMPRLYLALAKEDPQPIIDILERTPSIPQNCTWATFLRNHDELTLEMVTEEEREFMYNTYAPEKRARINLGIRRRLAPLLGGHRKKIELLHCLVLALPGVPVLYYGDEIGMGDNIWLEDRDGVRTPMQWNAERNGGFSSAKADQLYLPLVTDREYFYETLNVERQAADPDSLLNWVRHILALRKRFPAFVEGDLEFLQPDNRHALAFLRACESETVLVVANFSGAAERVELDLSAFIGRVPTELVRKKRLPVIESAAYVFDLAAFSFGWFLLDENI